MGRTLLLLLSFIMAPAALADEPVRDWLSSGGLIEEVISQTKEPYAFDWRRASMELAIGYGTMQESNVFENDAYQLTCGFPQKGGFTFNVGMRRIEVYQTGSSHKVGRTPFLQAAGSNRHEVLLGGAYSLLEGRSMSRLSPTIPDMDHVFFLVGGARYAHPNKSRIPAQDDKPEPYPGQKQVNAKLGLEVGLRWHLYTPQSFGLYFEALRVIPLGKNTGQLTGWSYFSGGLLWAFGV